MRKAHFCTEIVEIVKERFFTTEITEDFYLISLQQVLYEICCGVNYLSNISKNRRKDTRLKTDLTA